MIRLLKPCCVLALAVALLFVAAPVSAGDMSAVQKEVWKNIETYWDVWMSGDVDGFLEYFHDDYSGWSYDQPLASGKSSTEKWLTFAASSNKALIYEISPVSVTVHGDFAVAHYYFTSVTENPEGERKSTSGRWTDILVKLGDKWVLIADHGGESDDDD